MSVLDTVIMVLDRASYIYQICIIIYVFMSWLPNVQDSPVGRFFGRICEPYLSIFRRLIPPIGFIDLSPILAIIALPFLVDGIILVLKYTIGVFLG
jgi:YggT family protein